MKNKSLFVVLGALLLTHNLGATEYDAYRRFSNMNKDAQEKVKGKAQELISDYDAQQLNILKEHRNVLVGNIQRLETLLQQCKEGTIAPHQAEGCENENSYLSVHAFKLLLKHIEQKIEAETAKSHA